MHQYYAFLGLTFLEVDELPHAFSNKFLIPGYFAKKTLLAYYLFCW